MRLRAGKLRGKGGVLEAGVDDVVRRLDLSEPERRLLDRLGEPTLPDGLAAETGVTVPEVVATLVRLELHGLVRSVGGRYESTLRGRAASG
jgi:predicted Rossmann fold nucleotide-binding protein DprA/Smf involved in DNA uptake